MIRRVNSKLIIPLPFHINNLTKQRALEHYTALPDIKRVLGKAPALNPDFLVGFFGKLNKVGVDGGMGGWVGGGKEGSVLRLF